MRRLSLAGAVFLGGIALIGCVFYLNPECSDFIQNGNETDTDCGGTCGPCTVGRTCKVPADCDNGYCLAGTCEPLPCVNGKKDFDETDIDCGGGTCRKCSGAHTCRVDSDCVNGHCDAGGLCRSLRTIDFTDAVSYPSGDKTYALFAGDFNHDGKIDLAAANEIGSSITMFVGRGDGTFINKGSFPTGEFPTGGNAYDFNRDGNLDVVTANFHGNSVSVLFGNGDGTLRAVTDYPATAGGETSNLAIGDLNGDGYPDVIATNQAAGSISEFMGRVDGTLQPSVTSLIGKQGLEHVPAPFSAAIGDFDEDGHDDVAVGDNSFDVIIVRLGKGDGTFGPEVEYPEGGVPDYVVIAADLNLDGHLDLVVANRGSSDVSVLLGKGDGTFAPPIVSSTGPGTNPYSLATADFNQDGVPDVVTANFMSGTSTVLLGVGDGTFEEFIDAGRMSDISYGVVAADFDGDGVPDIATANPNSNDVTVKLSRSH